MSQKDKDFYRDLKRCIKKRGKKQQRAHLKRSLEQNPEEAHLENDYDYGAYSSEQYNGMDHDATRNREEPQQNVDEPPVNEVTGVD